MDFKVLIIGGQLKKLSLHLYLSISSYYKTINLDQGLKFLILKVNLGIIRGKWFNMIIIKRMKTVN